jgi:hypothetical protein
MENTPDNVMPKHSDKFCIKLLGQQIVLKVFGPLSLSNYLYRCHKADIETTH